jgi:hypothetical protein
MCDLLLRVTSVTSADIVIPQLPGATCAIVVVVAIYAARLLLRAVSGEAPVFAPGIRAAARRSSHRWACRVLVPAVLSVQGRPESGA